MARHFARIFYDDLIDAYGIGFRDMFQPPEWRRLLESIPSLKGRIMGDEIVLPEGHKAIIEEGILKDKHGKVKFIVNKKQTNEEKFLILSGAVDQIIILRCECGWNAGDITSLGKDYSKYSAINSLFSSHIKMPYDEIEYIAFTRHWLEDLPEDFIVKFLRFVKENKGILQLDFNTLTYTLIDDAMSDWAINEVGKMLEGHEMLTKSLKVFRKED